MSSAGELACQCIRLPDGKKTKKTPVWKYNVFGNSNMQYGVLPNVLYGQNIEINVNTFVMRAFVDAYRGVHPLSQLQGALVDEKNYIVKSI